jgi:hypothetical protein
LAHVVHFRLVACENLVFFCPEEIPVPSVSLHGLQHMEHDKTNLLLFGCRHNRRYGTLSLVGNTLSSLLTMCQKYT